MILNSTANQSSSLGGFGNKKRKKIQFLRKSWPINLIKIEYYSRNNLNSLNHPLFSLNSNTLCTVFNEKLMTFFSSNFCRFSIYFLLIHCYFVCDDSSSESVFSKQFKSPLFTLKCFVLYGFQKFQWTFHAFQTKL